MIGLVQPQERTALTLAHGAVYGLGTNWNAEDLLIFQLGIRFHPVHLDHVPQPWLTAGRSWPKEIHGNPWRYQCKKAGGHLHFVWKPTKTADKCGTLGMAMLVLSHLCTVSSCGNGITRQWLTDESKTCWTPHYKGRLWHCLLATRFWKSYKIAAHQLECSHVFFWFNSTTAQPHTY